MKTQIQSAEPVAICDQLTVSATQITNIVVENRIISLRDTQVIVDRDLALLYGVDTKRLNEQVRRNIEIFPESFRFQLSKSEKDELVINCDRFTSLKHSPALPYAFTTGLQASTLPRITLLSVESES